MQVRLPQGCKLSSSWFPVPTPVGMTSPSSPPPGMTPSPGPLTFQIHSPRSPVHYANCLPGTLSSLTHYPAPSHPSSMPIHSPTSFKGILCLVPAFLSPTTPSPLGPGLSHLLAKNAPTVTKAPSATAPVSTVLTEAQFPSRRRRASSRAPSPYRAVNSACGREGKQERKEKGISGEERGKRRGRVPVHSLQAPLHAQPSSGQS